MEANVVWSLRAEKSMARLLAYLRREVSEDFADKYLTFVEEKLIQLAAHPTKGMVIKTQNKVRRWKLDRRNYATYIIRKDGNIVIHNIFDYARNKKGFER